MVNTFTLLMLVASCNPCCLTQSVKHGRTFLLARYCCKNMVSICFGISLGCLLPCRPCCDMQMHVRKITMLCNSNNNEMFQHILLGMCGTSPILPGRLVLSVVIWMPDVQLLKVRQKQCCSRSSMLYVPSTSHCSWEQTSPQCHAWVMCSVKQASCTGNGRDASPLEAATATATATALSN